MMAIVYIHALWVKKGIPVRVTGLAIYYWLLVYVSVGIVFF